VPVTVVNSAIAAATTITIPTHQAGDLLVMYAWRNGSTTHATRPTGWTLIRQDAANTNAGQLAYRFATGSGTTSGTWTNATHLVVYVLRGASGTWLSHWGQGSGTSVSFAAMSALSSSLALTFGSHRTANNLAVPAGVTGDQALGTGPRTVAGRSTGPTSLQAVTVGASSGWHTYRLEVLDQIDDTMAIGGGTQQFGEAFPYSDGDLRTVGSAKWEPTALWTGQPSVRVVSNRAAGPASSGWVDAYTKDAVSTASAARDFVFRGVEMSTAATTWAYCDFHLSGFGNPSGYWVRFRFQTGSYFLTLGRLDAGAFTTLFTSDIQGTTGDDLAVRLAPDGRMELWRKPSAGSWAVAGAAVDTTYTSGRMALETFETTTRWSSVEVYDLVAAPVVTYRRRPRSVHVQAAVGRAAYR
jgi:hypothetical protein